jgi:hypothetical protein
MTMRIRREWILCGALAATSALTSRNVGAAPNCADLTRPGLFPNTVVQTATVVAADAKTGMPAYCEVTALITPVAGSKIFKAPGAAVPVEQITLVHEAVLSACDATDGLKDGVITDPRRCEWKPESLACKAGEAGGSCLTPPQVDALNAVYRTVRTPSGVVGNYGLTRGSEMAGTQS